MEAVQLICRQTNYSEEEAAAKLTEFGDPVKVIQAYMGVQTPVKNKNTNQLIFHEITKFVEEVNARKPS